MLQVLDAASLRPADRLVQPQCYQGFTRRGVYGAGRHGRF